MKIKISLEQLESLLDEQKAITIQKCLSHSYYYNTESTAGHMKTLPIDEEKFKEQGMSSKYPNDFEILKKYLCK